MTGPTQSSYRGDLAYCWMADVVHILGSPSVPHTPQRSLLGHKVTDDNPKRRQHSGFQGYPSNHLPGLHSLFICRYLIPTAIASQDASPSSRLILIKMPLQALLRVILLAIAAHKHARSVGGLPGREELPNQRLQCLPRGFEPRTRRRTPEAPHGKVLSFLNLDKNYQLRMGGSKPSTWMLKSASTLTTPGRRTTLVTISLQTFLPRRPNLTSYQPSPETGDRLDSRTGIPIKPNTSTNAPTQPST
jgi:hypothetical protein